MQGRYYQNCKSWNRRILDVKIKKKLEPEIVGNICSTGLEPVTYSLEGYSSTTELRTLKMWNWKPNETE